MENEMKEEEIYWLKCPQCGYPKMIKYYDKTVLVNFPAFCKRCRKEHIITIRPGSRIDK